MTINAGQKVAVVGASGCGKSTFVALLLRFYDPNMGVLVRLSQFYVYCLYPVMLILTINHELVVLLLWDACKLVFRVLMTRIFVHST